MEKFTLSHHHMLQKIDIAIFNMDKLPHISLKKNQILMQRTEPLSLPVKWYLKRTKDET